MKEKLRYMLFTVFFTPRNYPRIEDEAKLTAEEPGISYLWNETTLRDATEEDEKWIQQALDGEEATGGNGDWAMAYNSVIYNAFGRSSPASSPTRIDVNGRRSGKQKKVVAGKCCGKVWMSNHVHPYLAKKDPEEEEHRSFHAWAMPDEKLEGQHRNFTGIAARLYSISRHFNGIAARLYFINRNFNGIADRL
ncbi:unnamed protein product [Prunus armeniaca]|uniref:Uncharacterized protein n=1 Tax=Prunus armeniaca TaxID=36596 RepID=A0A6J5XXD8_PRUAR|nr:unnamed protein product [Prunus armeniaca]